MTKDNGGSAFPFFDERVMNTPEYGMSLRDYFAAKAMHAMTNSEYEQIFRPEDWAKHAYQMADAMLAERAK